MLSRTIRMTVYAIEAHLLEVSSFSEGEGAAFLPGRIIVKAQGGGEFHEWRETGDRKWWPGDTIDVTIEDATT